MPLGRFDLDDAVMVCSKCSYRYGDQLSAVVHAGFWPANSRNYRYLFSCRLLKFYDTLHKYIPGTSVAGFIRTLEEMSACNGRVCLHSHFIFDRFMCMFYHLLIFNQYDSTTVRHKILTGKYSRI